MGKSIEYNQQKSNDNEEHHHNFFMILKKHKNLLKKYFIEQQKNKNIPNDIIESIQEIKNSFIKSKTKIEEEKQNISLKLERITQNNIQLLDFNCLQNIFLYLPNLNHKKRGKKLKDCISFSKTSKKNYQISKDIIFETIILNKKISIPFSSFKHIVKIPHYKYGSNEKLALFCIENNIPSTIIPTLNKLPINFQLNPFIPLKHAIKKNNLELIKSCVHFGIDINHKFHRRYWKESAPLLLAVQYGDLDTVKYLISIDADKNTVDNYGNNCLLTAAMEGKLDMLKYLLSIGFDKNFTNNDGNNCLLLAASGYALDTIKYLLSIGFDINFTNQDGYNCLLLAALNGRLDLLKYLLSIGCEKNCTNNDGDNCLLFAARSGRLDTVKYLLSIGFDKNFTNNNGENCLLCAVPRIKPAHILNYASWIADILGVVKYLISIGFDKNFRDNRNRTALDIANNCNYRYIIEFLESLQTDN